MTAANNYHEEEILGKAYDTRLMKRLLGYVRPYRWMLAGAVGALLLNSFFQIFIAFVTQTGIDDYILAGDAAGLGRVAGVYLAVMAVIFVTSYGQVYMTAWLGQRVQDDIRMQIFCHLQKLHLGFYDKNPVGRLVTRVTNDVNTLNEMFSSGVVTIIGDIVLLTLIIAAMLYLNWQLALITFVSLPLLVAVTFIFRARARDAYRLVRLKLARLNAFVQEHLTGMSLVQLFTREKRTFDEFTAINRDLQTQHFRSVIYYAVFYPTVEIIGALSLGLLFYYGGIRILDDSLTYGQLVAFIFLVEQFFRPIRDLSEKYNILQASMASSERIFKLIDTEPAISETAHPTPIRNFSGRIDFENVWFAYNEWEWVLRDVSFSVAPGEKVAIVGATGAGKTSLVSLLYRFYDYQKGSIKIDGVDLRQLHLTEHRSRLGLVLQDVFLFSGDYAGNIRLRQDNISDDEILRALERVGFGRFLKDLPQGIHTPVRERGATLSTGQKQLLSFARALAFDPRILILDEATSSVDSETEKLIQAALEELLRDRTSIIIAHRLSTIEKADKIVVLHHGQLREMGRHDELLIQKGIYYKLYQMQYKKQAITCEATPPAVNR
ncbi:MAG: ABC transporter ATP-binding protein/permease [candidate division Zixibacteria bacterium]|nr:ABC transporter ATP-binding protein/permease [candidate division Zixibacteria bacterium]